MKKIFAFPGRFQPFGPHHFKAYQRVCQIHGQENVFIVTSNSPGPKNPLTFLEKQAVMAQYGIPPSQVVCCKSPYKPEELLQRFDQNKDSLIICCGEKDKERINTQPGSYYTNYMGQVYTKPFKSQGYLYIVPNQKLNHKNQEISGTVLRDLLPTLTPQEFKNLVGWYNAEIHELFKQKFPQSQLGEIYQSIKIDENAITKTQLQRVEQYADRLFREFGIDIEFQNLYAGTHFLQRLNDPRNINQITTDELRNIFKKASEKYGNVLAKSPDKAEGVLKDMESDINMPFIIKLDRKNGELDFIPKTIMRKKGFYSNTPVFSMETYQSNVKHLLKESNGYTRHIMHPYEDDDLTFSEFYEFLLDSCWNNNCFATIKMDGINLQATLKGGKVYCNRNKGSVINPMTLKDLSDKYKDIPDLQGTFTSAFKAIEKYILENLTHLDWNSGLTFLNFEILHPNIGKNYKYSEVPTLAIHNLTQYDSLGNLINSAPYITKQAKVNEYEITSTPQAILHPIPSLKLKDFIETFRIFIERLNPYGINKNSKIGEIPTDQLKHEFKVFCLNIGNEIIQNHFPEYSKAQIENIKKIQLELKNIANRLGEMDEKDQTKFKNSYKTWKETGMQINPEEGFVIPWKNNKTYKWTGSFAPINQILGIFKYNR